MNKKKPILPPSIERYIIALSGVILINLGLLFFLRAQVKTIDLLKDQTLQLEQDQKIINSSEEIYNRYKNDIEEISKVFPSEEELLPFLQTLENLAKQYSDESSVRFTSKSPQPESDMLFLLFTITMHTDADRTQELLKRLEKLPYMTRLLNISMGFPEGVEKQTNVSLNLKVYVKNPFSAQ